MSDRSPRRTDPTDVATGVFLIAVAALFGWGTTDLTIGTAFRMGPGYFPMILSAVLAVLGLVILLRALRATQMQPFGSVAWRGIVLILAAPIFFGATVRGLGFVPSLFITTLIAAFASEKMSAVKALILAVIVTIASTLIFSYGLGLPFRRFGAWLSM